MALDRKTLALHHAYKASENKDAVAVPLHATTAYSFGSVERAADRFAYAEIGNIYTRLTNPTNEVLEKRLAALEGGVGAIVTSSGASAISTTLLTLLRSGDHVVASASLYGGTFILLSVTLKRFGITTTFVEPDDIEGFEKAIQPNTRAIYTEVLGNPKLDFVDIDRVSEIAHRNDIPLIVDNTITPGIFRPIEHGADIVIHSLSKYICGNGTYLGGAVIDAGKFNWANGKFPEFTEPSPNYHGLRYWDALGHQAFIFRLRFEGLRDLGTTLSPASAFQIIQGLETLDVRIRRAGENALKLAQWLEEHPLVEWVNYPGLKSSKYHELASKNLDGGCFSGIITIGIKGGYEAAKKFANSTEIFQVVANIGDSKSILLHPASTSHSQLNEEQQRASGVTPDLVRLSIGLEDVEDLKADIDQALRK